MAKSIDQLNKDIASLSKQLEALTNAPAPVFNITGISDAITAVNTLTLAIKTAQNQAASLASGFGSIYQTLVDIVGELKATNTPTNLFAKSFVNIQNSAQKLYLHQSGINRLSSDELKSIKSKIEGNQEIVKLHAESIYSTNKHLLLDRNGKELNTGNLSLRLRSLVAQKQISLIRKGIAYIDKQSKEGIDVEQSALCYLNTWANVPGHALLKFWQNVCVENIYMPLITKTRKEIYGSNFAHRAQIQTT